MSSQNSHTHDPYAISRRSEVDADPNAYRPYEPNTSSNPRQQPHPQHSQFPNCYPTHPQFQARCDINTLAHAVASSNFHSAHDQLCALQQRYLHARENRAENALTKAVTDICANSSRCMLLQTLFGRVLMGSILPVDTTEELCGNLKKALLVMVQTDGYAMIATPDGAAILFHLVMYPDMAEAVARVLFNRGNVFTAVHMVERKGMQHRLKSLLYNIIRYSRGQSGLLLLTDILADSIQWPIADYQELYVPIPELEIQSVSEPLDSEEVRSRLENWLLRDPTMADCLLYAPMKDSAERSHERRTQQSEHTVVEALYHQLSQTATWGRFQKKAVQHITEILGARGERGNSRPFALCVINQHNGHAHTFVHWLLQRDLVELCCCKAASIIQQIVYTYPQMYLRTVVERLTEDPNKFKQVLTNPYGNYVITTILQVSESCENHRDERARIAHWIQYLEQSMNSPHTLGCAHFVIDYLHGRMAKAPLNNIGTKILLQLDGQR